MTIIKTDLNVMIGSNLIAPQIPAISHRSLADSTYSQRDLVINSRQSRDLSAAVK